MTRSDVIRAFLNHTPNTNSRTALNVRDGKLYSYSLCIAEYISLPEEGFSGILIHDHTASGLGMVSMTTSHHVSAIKQATNCFPRMVRSK